MICTILPSNANTSFYLNLLLLPSFDPTTTVYPSPLPTYSVLFSSSLLLLLLEFNLASALNNCCNTIINDPMNNNKPRSLNVSSVDQYIILYYSWKKSCIFISKDSWAGYPLYLSCLDGKCYFLSTSLINEEVCHHIQQQAGLAKLLMWTKKE